MNNLENCLDILVNSCKKKVAPWSTGMGSVDLNFYRNKNGNVLIIIGSVNTEIEHKYLIDLDVISKEEIFLRFFTGCVGPSTINYMLESFDEYHDVNVLSDISTFLQSLGASKIILCYTELMGGATATLILLHKICQQVNIECIPIIIKPALINVISSYQRDFNDLLDYFNMHTYHIYGEDFEIIKGNVMCAGLNNIGKEELLKIANSII